MLITQGIYKLLLQKGKGSRRCSLEEGIRKVSSRRGQEALTEVQVH